VNNYSGLQRRYSKEDLEAIIGKAQELYNKTRESYDRQTLSETASDLDIPKEYIDQAIFALKEENAIKEKERKSRLIVLAVAGGLLAVIVMVIIAVATGSTPDAKLRQMRDTYYNDIVRLDENVKTQAVQVENVIQRRFDLIPKLSGLVREYSRSEKEIIQALTGADMEYKGALSFTEKTRALGRLDQVIDAYTKSVSEGGVFKSTELYQSLMFEITGSDNRISVERKRYNDAVSAYNTFVRQYPLAEYVEKLGFDRQKEYWEDK